MEIATQAAGVYCVNTLDPHYAHLWCEIINILAIMLAAPHVIRFERRMKQNINTKHQPGVKLWTFKAFVFLQFVQVVLFGLLNGQIFSPTAYITYDDLYYGIPATITCIEAWIFTSIFIWSFSTKEYAYDIAGSQGYRMPHWQALFNCFNITDLFGAIVFMVRLLVEGQWLAGRGIQAVKN